MKIGVREARKEDLPGILDLVKELALYEKAPQEVTADLHTYQTAFKEGIFEAIVAEEDGEILGTCIFYMTFSTWKGKMLYLEDFVVRQSARRKGIGKLLFEKYLEMAREKECALVKWQVLDWNEPALSFYKKYDAIIEKEWWNAKIIF